MADRRMFSKRVISSARFVKMPISTQALYFHLGVNADDDGVVEAYTVLRACGATEDDLRVLVSKGFVSVLNEDLVTYITDWKENNKIRADRKVDSIYKDLLLQMIPEANLQQPKPRADTKKLTGGGPVENQRADDGRPMDAIGKDRLGKDRTGKDRLGKEPRHRYGEYKNVLLSDKDYAKLVDEFPTDYQDRIDRLSEYMRIKGKTYKDHLATIRAWARKDAARAKEKKGRLDWIDEWSGVCDSD